MEQQISRLRETREFKFSAGIGALVLTYAGAAWALATLVNTPSTSAWEFGVLTLPVLTLSTLGVMRLVAVARLPIGRRSGAEAIESARQGRRMGVLFAAVFAVEIVLIAITALLLARAGRPLLVPVAVAAIVGAHFLPLARIFHIPTYGFAGLLLVGSAVGSLLIADESARVFSLGILTALVLWASAGAVLAIHTGRPSAIGAV